jgi:hypothetical protein
LCKFLDTEAVVPALADDPKGFGQDHIPLSRPIGPNLDTLAAHTSPIPDLPTGR